MQGPDFLLEDTNTYKTEKENLRRGYERGESNESNENVFSVCGQKCVSCGDDEWFVDKGE